MAGVEKEYLDGRSSILHKQFIHLMMTNEGGLRFLITVIYASNRREDRRFGKHYAPLATPLMASHGLL